MSRRPGQRDVLYEGSPALKELIETYATMDVKAFCAKWDLAIATVRSTASRRGLLRLRVKVPKKDTANTVKPTARRGRKPKAVETPPPPAVPAYEPPKDLIPPNVLKRVKGKRREWKAPTRREELNCVPVPYPFCLQSDLRFTKEDDKTPAESHKPVKHDKNR